MIDTYYVTNTWQWRLGYKGKKLGNCKFATRIHFSFHVALLQLEIEKKNIYVIEKDIWSVAKEKRGIWSVVNLSVAYDQIPMYSALKCIQWPMLFLCKVCILYIFIVLSSPSLIF